MTMPKGWKPHTEDRAKREAEDRAKREAESIVDVITTKEPKQGLQQQDIVQDKNVIRPEENADYLRNYREPFADNMALWQYSTIAWIDIYKEFAINAAKLTEQWFNLFWNPWTKEQRAKDKVKVE